jgi:hypothetical protein
VRRGLNDGPGVVRELVAVSRSSIAIGVSSVGLAQRADFSTNKIRIEFEQSLILIRRSKLKN